MPAVLSAEEIDAALEALPAWAVEGGSLTRTVQAAGGAPALLRSIDQVAQELDHHPDSDVDGDNVRFRLSTHSAGGVTELDVDLAARIDQVLSGSQATGTDPAQR